VILDYKRESLMAFITSAIGSAKVERMWPRVDRLVIMWQQCNELSGWLEENVDLIGSKEYKENVTSLNALLQNTRNLENDLAVFEERRAGVDDSADLLSSLGLGSGKKEV